MHRCFLRAVLAALVLLPLAIVAPLGAQVGATTDIVTGKVTAPDGRPVANAQVAVQSVETQVTRNRTTNERGQYTVVFPDGGGQYRVTVRAIGFQPATISVTRHADEDRLEGDVVLQRAQAPQTLAGVTIRATQPRPQTGLERPAPGTSERVLSGDQLNRLPIDGGDPAALAALSSGVVTTGADTSGSNAAGFSVAGQRPDLNQVTLDGLTFGGGGVPQEAVRNTRVVTNTYDVARGQFTGGQVATTTRAGTNVVQGSLGYDLREPNLQFADDESAAYGQRFTQHQLSGGLGGPLVRDRLFLFGSFQFRHRAEGLQSLLEADEAILGRLGTSYDSVRRFLGVLGASGVPAAATGAPDERLADNLTTIARLDWNATERQTLTLRGDWRFGEQGGTRISPLGVPHAGGDLASLGGGAMLTLTSQWDNGMINELRAYGSLDQRDSDPYIQLPGGRVRVRSVLPDGVASTTSLEFGGNAGLPQSVDNSQLELTDELSWISPGGAHRLKVGALLNATAFDQTSAYNRYGTFVFDSIAALERGIASSFTRTLSPTNRDGASVNQALYFGDTWRATRALQLVLGGRLEGTQYTGAPRYNAAIDTAFGLRTDRFPSEVHVSPRVGFTWTLGMPAQGQGGAGGAGTPGAPGRGPGGAGGGGGGGRRQGGGPGARPQGPFGAAPALILRGGFGEFRGRVPSGLFTSAVGATGLPGTETQLVCVGDAVPAIDWSAWLADPATIPTACADGSSGGSTFGSRAPNVAAFDEDFSAPRSWRASLGAQRRLVGRYFLNVEGAFSRGVGLYGVTDRNLVDVPVFTLADEGGRPVYVPETAIVDSTGQINSLASRRDRRFAGVYEVGSGLRSTTTQLTVGVNGFTGRGLLLSASYTWSRSRDESSFSCCSAQQAFGSPTTAGDPNVREWSTSDYERRHVVVTTATMPVHPSLELTGVLRVTSGQPYTPRVAGDLNGDGVRNDRAFVYDPAGAPDTAIANGMQRLLRSAPDDVRECLESQVGRVAGRNTCRGAWFPSVDLRMNYRPDRLGLKRNLMLSFLFVNPLAGLDQLLHGDDRRGWGQPVRVDPNLLYVRGFDRDANRFRYEVNERFGAQRGTRNAYRQPFQLAFNARYTIGPDRQRQMLQAAQAAARSQGTGLGAGNAGALARLAPNPFGQILALPDSLGLALTPAQAARLAVLRDTLAAKNQRLAERVQAQIQRAGNNADPAAMLALVREPLEEARANFDRAIEEARAVLTPGQWAKVPESVKTPQLQGPRGQQQRENRQERRREP